MATLDELKAEHAILKQRRAELLTMQAGATVTAERLQAERGAILLAGDQAAADKNGHDLAITRDALRDIDTMLKAVAERMEAIAPAIVAAEDAAQMDQVRAIEARLPQLQMDRAKAYAAWKDLDLLVEEQKTLMLSLGAGYANPNRPARIAALLA